MIGAPQLLALWLALQRGAELLLARRNTRRLLAQGGREVGSRHYPAIVAVHAGWLLCLAFLVPADAPVLWPLLAVFFALQAARIWVIASLGPFWTTRIITMPDAPLVRRGPFRWVRHPNYLVVALEIPVLSLALDQAGLAALFGIANLLVLRHRIRIEDAALAPRRNVPATEQPPAMAP
ncbi:MAG: isoprenylcysteine carboxylmethyltransferase family protein [Azospirillaceae bacterium]|nr:isoprenylcysteine carboxylmethyltransferase family protein [Azospirillaceae bacterium]